MFGDITPFSGPPNPFAINTMFFKIDAVHDETGSTREGVLSVNIPFTATELQARKLILEMAYQCGWRLKEINRIDNQSQECSY